MTENVPSKESKPDFLEKNLMSCEIKKDGSGEEKINFEINTNLLPAEIKTKNEALSYISKRLFGTANSDIANETALRSANSMPHGIPDEEKYNIILNSCQEMKPKDLLEARLCAKETTLYTTAMQYMMRAERNLASEEMGACLWHETHINIAMKLLRIHNETVQTLSKLRRGGEQKFTVQHHHFHVNDGGKAAIMAGSFQARGGVKEKNGD